MLTTLSGAIGDVVFSRGRYGPYVRSRVNPDETASAQRTAIWAAMGDTAAAWSALDPADQAAWSAYARSITRPSRIGHHRNLTGRLEFSRANLLPKFCEQFFAHGYAVREEVPAWVPPQPFTPWTATLNGTGTQLIISHPDSSQYQTSEEAAIVVWISPPLPGTRRTWPGPFYCLKDCQAPGTTPEFNIDIPIGAQPDETQNSRVRMRYFDSEGHLHPPWYQTVRIPA